MKSQNEIINDISEKLNIISYVLSTLSATLNLLSSSNYADKAIADTFLFLEYFTGQTSEQLEELSEELTRIVRHSEELMEILKKQ